MAIKKTEKFNGRMFALANGSFVEAGLNASGETCFIRFRKIQKRKSNKNIYQNTEVFTSREAAVALKLVLEAILA